MVRDNEISGRREVNALIACKKGFVGGNRDGVRKASDF
jgi:hypothetical protein